MLKINWARLDIEWMVISEKFMVTEVKCGWQKKIWLKAYKSGKISYQVIKHELSSYELSNRYDAAMKIVYIVNKKKRLKLPTNFGNTNPELYA